MRSVDCDRLDDVLEAVQAGRWPHCEPGLRAHAEACAVCQDLIVVAQALLDEGGAARHEAVVPNASAVYLRAQRRAREEAARVAAWPVLVAQGIAGACLAGLVLAFLGPLTDWFSGATAWVQLRWPGVPDVTIAGLRDSSLIVQAGLLFAALAGVVLAPVALYLAVWDD